MDGSFNLQVIAITVTKVQKWINVRRFSMRVAGFIIAVVASFFATVAVATPVVWTVNGTLASGKVITGSFTYDADTNTHSAINISSTGGVGPFTIIAPASSSTINIFTVSPLQTGQVGILILSAAKTNAGGTLPITGGLLFDCLNPTCTSLLPRGGESFSSGTLVGAAPAAVPTLSQWVMVLLGLTLAGTAAVLVQRSRFAT